MADTTDGDSRPIRPTTYEDASARVGIDASGKVRHENMDHADTSGNDETVIFKDHHDSRYVWPYELCRSIDTTRLLVEEVYTLLGDAEVLEVIRERRYDIITDDGAIIIPTVWSSIVKPSMTLRVSFRAKRPVSSPSSDGRGQPRHVDTDPDESSWDDGRYRGHLDRERIQEIEFDVGVGTVDRSPPPRRRSETLEKLDDDGTDNGSDDSGNVDADGSELDLSTTDDDPLDGSPDIPEPFRSVKTPTDIDGNRLSFAVNTSDSGDCLKQSESTDRHDITASLAQNELREPEILKITKAISNESENRSAIILSTLPGPEIPRLRGSVRIRWYHLTAERPDFAHFKRVCLAAPNLSDRLQKLTRALLVKVEKQKIKASLDGLFIEPGTVLRADEKCQPDPQSAIFSCVPYFALQPLAKKSTTGLRAFPARTLMQSYYPYEPVRERDAEQAYKKFSNSHSTKLVHVPSLWVMNLGPDVVVTCGHRTLAENMTNSIEVVQEDLKQLVMAGTSTNTMTSIRLADWDGRVLVFPLDSCRSYFQMEQKLRELRNSSQDGVLASLMQMTWKSPQGEELVTPSGWSAIITRTDCVFIDILAITDKRAQELSSKSIISNGDTPIIPTCTTVPPFLSWPLAGVNRNNDEAAKGPLASESKRLLSCLEDVERGMLSETLDELETTNVVDKTFASTAFYQSLPEGKLEDIIPRFASLQHGIDQCAGRSHHEALIGGQVNRICKKSLQFCSIVQATMDLFVREGSNSTILRKVWSAMGNVHAAVDAVIKRSTLQGDPDDTNKSDRTQSARSKRSWFVRNANRENHELQPNADEKFKRSIRRCERCGSLCPFLTQEDAIEHLKRHLKPANQPTRSGNPTDQKAPVLQVLARDNINLGDWVANYSQLHCEDTNAGVVAILNLACEESLHLYQQAKELADGVRDEHLNMLQLYTLPRQLLEAFRQLLVFYLAIERALHYTEVSFQENNAPGGIIRTETVPYFPSGLEVLRRFSGGARRSILVAREELCNMASLDQPENVLKNLSFGSEYVCSWLMRRLIVQPLDRKMTVGDMYREYLSTIQFQVNHRPSKRLLRSINLLQEELLVLTKINIWQANLIRSYMSVLDDATHEKDIPFRRSMFPYERMLLGSCLESLALSREDYEDLSSRCLPLAESTKQILEITEEDHGKAIMVFTLVTIVFLPLSFVTSYLGMNTVDIRDMGSTQSIFWSIAIPLTFVTMGTALFVGYNGDDLRDNFSAIYRVATGKQDRNVSARGISVAQRKRVGQLQSDSNSLQDYTSLADEAEYANPRPEYIADDYGTIAPETTTYLASEDVQDINSKAKIRRSDFQTQSLPGAVSYQSKYNAAPAYVPVPRARQQFQHAAGVRRTAHANPYAYDGDVGRVRIPASNPTPRIEIVPVTTYGDIDDGAMQPYTWHKKRRHDLAGRGRHVRMGTEYQRRMPEQREGKGEYRRGSRMGYE